MPLVWVTGSSGLGKSTVCATLRARGHEAVDADDDGYCHWVERASGTVVADVPDPPDDWLTHFSWRIDRAALERLAVVSPDRTVFVCGTVENEVEVWDLFDRVVCLVADDDVVRDRLRTRDTNAFGKRPEQLAAVLRWNHGNESLYRGRGAALVDATLPAHAVADAVIRAAARPVRAAADEGSTDGG